MKPHVIYIVFGERVDLYENSPPWAVCWRHTEDEALAVRDTLQIEARRFRREMADVDRVRRKARKKYEAAYGEDTSFERLYAPADSAWLDKSERLRAAMIDRLFPCSHEIQGVRYYMITVTDDPSLAVGAWPILRSRTRGTR